MTDPVTFFREAIPSEWFTGPVDVIFDRDEILVAGCLAPEIDPAEFRERSRPHRVRIASQAEARYLRKVSWAIRQNDTEVRFTTVSVPVMTRLRIDERTVLDALIDGGLARTRSEALAWCVRLVGRHQREWLDELVTATEAVRAVRERGPRL
ncbi:MAG TPA: hypothetical protein VM282_17985 [Acidimicrobiales bacterium]|nr:hypothetical protein [Acidimicrobiales bacterium]